jgi:hypothetical protein
MELLITGVRFTVTILAQSFQEFHSTVEPAVPIIFYDVDLLKAAKTRVRSAAVMD